MNRKTLTTAILAGLTGMAGMVSVSNAVNVNPDGLGQVLLYPYYSARGGNDTLISIVNTTTHVKALKVRFHEALNSREVLDFNIYMSPWDVWTAAVTDAADGRAQLLVGDTTCTAPYFQGGTAGDVGAVPMVDFQYNSDPVDTTGDGVFDFIGTLDGPPEIRGLERTQSGYIEIVEMGNIDPDATVLWNSAKHTAAGVPPSGGPFGAPCERITERWRRDVVPPNCAGSSYAPGFWQFCDSDADMIPVTGGVFGNASIINVAEGTKFGYDAVAIDGFWEFGSLFHTDPGDVAPSLAAGNANTSLVFNNGMLDQVEWPASIFAVNHTLTFNRMMNEYMIDAGLGARSEWVVTMPTKRFHADAAAGGPNPGLAAPVAPFTDVWRWPYPGNPQASKPFACETLQLRVWDREEQEPTTTTGICPGGVIINGICVSPPPPPTPGQPGFQLCKEANVIRFDNDPDSTPPGMSEIFKEPRRADVAGGRLGYTNFSLPAAFGAGWVRFDMNDKVSVIGERPTGQEVQTYGLPVTGFWAQRFSNELVEFPEGSGEMVLSNYGGTFSHRGSRRVENVLIPQ
jgi:hypothetical protein